MLGSAFAVTAPTVSENGPHYSQSDMLQAILILLADVQGVAI